MKKAKYIISCIIFAISLILMFNINYACNLGGRSGTTSSGSSSSSSSESTNIIFDDTTYDGLGAIAKITLTDSDLTSGVTTVDVDVTSDSDTTGITVTLTRSGSSYYGTVELSSDTDDGADKISVISDLENIKVTYHDADPTADISDSAKYDQVTAIYRVYTEQYVNHEGTTLSGGSDLVRWINDHWGSITSDFAYTTDFYEGTKAWWLNVTANGSSGHTIVFDTGSGDNSKDLSGFSDGYLKFDLNAPAGFADLWIKIKDDVASGSTVEGWQMPVSVCTGNWEKVSLKFSDAQYLAEGTDNGINFSKVVLPVLVGTSTIGTFIVDNIRWIDP